MSTPFGWAPPGPITAEFMANYQDDVVGIMGPVGSGKTTSALLKLFFASYRQPRMSDGIRRWYMPSIRDTYRQIWRATIPSWLEWFPKSRYPNFTGSEGGPATHIVEVKHPVDGGTVIVQVDFVAIGDNAAEDVLRGYQFSVAHLGECDLLDPSVLIYVRGRVGRAPKQLDGGVWWPGIVLEYNAPDDENYLYRLFEEQRPPGHRLYKLPSGLSPQAENIQNLIPGYYERQMHGQPDWYIRRMIRNQYGYSRDGKPIFEAEYNDQVHCALTPFEPDRGLPIGIGLDAGGTPAAVFTQRRPNGQWRVFDELVVEGGFCGPGRFSDYLNRKLKDYEGLPIGEAAADPSAAFGADKDDGEKDWITAVAAKSEIRIRAAQTNAIGTRLEAVRVPLTRMIDGGVPGFVLSPRCKKLRKGFNSGYRYRRMKIAGGERYDDKPDKNDYSHPMDALQYIMLRGGEYQAARGRGKELDRRRQARNQVRAILTPADDPDQFDGYVDARLSDYRDAEL